MDYKQILKDFLGVEVAEAVTSPEVVEKIVEVEKPTRIRKAYRPHSDEQMFGMLKDGKLEDLKKALEENIRYEAEQSKGTSKSELTCIKKILDMKSPNKIFCQAHEFSWLGDTWYGFTEGHYILASMSDYGYEHAEKPLDLSKFFNDGTYDVEIQIDKTDLKTFCKTHKPKKGTNPVPYIIKLDDEKVLGVNPYFLLNTLEFCDTDKIYLQGELVNKAEYCYKNPIRVATLKNIGLVIPVNIAK